MTLPVPLCQATASVSASTEVLSEMPGYSKQRHPRADSSGPWARSREGSNVGGCHGVATSWYLLDDCRYGLAAIRASRMAIPRAGRPGQPRQWRWCDAPAPGGTCG